MFNMIYLMVAIAVYDDVNRAGRINLKGKLLIEDRTQEECITKPFR